MTLGHSIGLKLVKLRVRQSGWVRSGVEMRWRESESQKESEREKECMRVRERVRKRVR